MKSPDSNENAVAGMENWIATLRVRNGYGGPSIGPDGDSLSYCGTAFDWRYEGFLDGCAALYRATGQADYLDRIERDLRAICSAQLLNGTFRNSWFDQNPYEGGMPYEPALLAAACRARTVLTESGRSAPAEFDRALELFVETRLLNELWNRLLHTFNDWLQSRFEYYTPHAVAAAIELLMDYADLTEDWPRLKPYVIGAADSLLTLQCSSGSLSGGIPLSNQRGSAFSPAMAARCAPALIKAADKTGQEKYRQAAVALADFVRRQAQPGGGFAFLVFNDRPVRQFPIITGAVADIVNSFERAGLLLPNDTEHLETFLAGKQMETGAFISAVGSADPSGRSALPDWRDILPCCGWQDKIYSFLARQHNGRQGTFQPAEVRRPVRVRGRCGEYIENENFMCILNRVGKTLYLWEKGSKWAGICLL
ncbi:MAG: hypothetical protein PWQ29_1675 [Verrucomicrobiota bacterium]|jgi:hypothetical protein|nr:hypothetical protein [Verrucomicrobiota bacterium]MDK2964281.1 hypothetical protein [Verrucomicrobiota bacterium]